MLHLLYGEEDLLAQEELHKLTETLGPPDLVSLNQVQLDAATLSFNDLQGHCFSMPFLAPVRLVVVSGLLARFNRRPGGSANQSTRRGEALREWGEIGTLADTMPETTCLVLIDGEVDRGNSLLKSLTPHAQVRQFSKLRGRALESWARERARQLEVSFAPDAFQALLKYGSNNLRSLSNELEKLALYTQGNPVQKADVESLVTEAREATVFRLVDMVAEGNLRQAERLLYLLTQDGAAAPYLLFMLARQYRLILLAKALQAKGVRGSAIQTQLGVPEFAYEKVMQQASLYTESTLKAIMERLVEADVALKTGLQQGEVALELLVADLAGRSRTAHRV